MKSNVLVILVALTAAAISAMFVSNKLHARQNKIFEQTFVNAKASVLAPKLNRDLETEKQAKEELKDINAEIYFYKRNISDVEYSLVYAKYPAKVNFDGAISGIANTFKNYNFQYTTQENKVSDLDAVLLTGSFHKDETKYGIKEQLIKNNNTLWQFIVIFRDECKNAKLAQDYIDSIKIVKE